ncbi:sorbosone dehydrogenase family protein [Bradyrhizobium sp. JYMT SZCCT0428]|uniref:PQQ-dependent sugar dehydrogenase n=1 Tax=Bradyrhizobium sp. JYMT SZCCT0428 TaxID=2807673 RepID=UPI001BA83FB8|nr:PQQ-dependent sugar dehydrogenase [Bradyrhizobium sp. JYMT SZCCT0428]MBR1156246.1 PQQ-dependent sugar dehydrogenase [Bradyrhizobium sp. JYMT SZCCT0428]
MNLRLKTAAALVALATWPAYAQPAPPAPSALETLGAMRPTGNAAEWPEVSQTGGKADKVKENLKKIKLPAGFHISLYALVPDARHISVGPQGVATFVGTRKSKIWVVTDRSRGGIGDEVKEFAPTLPKKIPNGPCFSKDGFLYIAEQNRVLEYPAAEFFYESPDVVASVVVAEGELIPKSEESYNHTARVCRVGPDNKLYIQLGQPYNVPTKEKNELYRKLGIGGIIRMDRDGKNREVYAIGLRNPVGMDFNPQDKSLWTNDNQVDGMGDDQPPGELNRIASAGLDFGFPWYGGGKIRTNEYKNDTPPANVVFPQVEQAAHAADLGLIFYTGTMFPQKYRGAIFSTQHGSWNRTVPVGARLMVTFLKEDGNVAGKSEAFAEGWNENGYYLGRPVDVAQLADGSLLVSDDLVGALYRIWYDGK